MVVIANANIYKFTLPLTRPLTVGGISMNSREGLLLRLSSKEGHEGWGEISPLPGYSADSLELCREELLRTRGQLAGQTVAPDRFRAGAGGQPFCEGAPAPVRFGVDTALLNLLAAATDRAPASLVAARYFPTVAVNGLIVDDTDPAESIRRMRAAGYSAVKMKLGRADLTADIQRTRAALNAMDNQMKLRLDVNRGWSFDQAVQFAKEINDPCIEYVEEPLANLDRLADLAKDQNLPLALDESLVGMAPEQLAELDYLAAVVLKPTALGGLEEVRNLAEVARQKEMKIVISSCFESSVGLAALVQLAAAIGSPGSPAGVDTLDWFAEDVTQKPLATVRGQFDPAKTWQAARALDLSRLTEVHPD